ncbi:hypothetical protein OF83DRAFT_1179131 [Amylostereum chailletii]|nr:hypothetical protein OF83DRAFT_1179131 [Amylostereum chailletii]
MFSFMKIATIAALAFGTFASAVPIVEERSVAPVVEARQAQTLSTVLTTLQNSLTPAVAPLNSLTATTATPESVTAIAANINVALQVAIDSVKKLPKGAIGGLDIVVSLSVILNLIFVPIGKVYGFPGVDQVALKVIFVGIGTLVAELLTLVLGVLRGVLSLVVGLLVGLIGGIVPIILELNITVLINVLLL